MLRRRSTSGAFFTAMRGLVIAVVIVGPFGSVCVSQLNPAEDLSMTIAKPSVRYGARAKVRGRVDSLPVIYTITGDATQTVDLCDNTHAILDASAYD